ncbi:MAG: acyl-CoA dehydrogenase family protein [Deltaproteobacteria bacterium]|nr:acyl-CoA dehydrogenase family protein [Deltaproteobacteria bacterium]
MTQLKMGGAFLLEPVEETKIFIREDLNDEQIAFGKACSDFFEKEVLPKKDAIEKHENNVSVDLMKKAGELGFLMVEVPEAYGGLGMDKRTATVVTENAIESVSFGVTVMCHTGIATLPILYFGTEEQKQKYLPKLASGEFIGAYALTEAGAGSDALGCKTKAVLSEDKKHYILNGSKMFITNGAWADLLTVFAKVDGEKFTAFLVEKTFPGVSHSVEEKKMGIKGSSTTVINLDDCKVPVENVLGEIGKGHKIAFNVLNIGRWKLGAASVGGCKKILKHMVPYTKERCQFGKSISEFGLIRKKIADCAINAYVTESIMYRIAGLYDDAAASIDKSDPHYDRKCIEAIENYAIEASIAKVFGSEALWRCADEGVQALGGYGFSSEYPLESIQRDCRINRIFEGTNEINRLIIPGTLLKRAMKGEIDLMGEIPKILGELKKGFTVQSTGDFSSGAFRDRVNLAKKLAVYACGVAVQKYMADIKDQQYVMEKMANLAIDTFAMDSAMKRTMQILQKENTQTEIVPVTKNNIPVCITQVFVYEAYERMLMLAKDLLAEVADGNAEEFAKYNKALKRFDVFDPINSTRQREVIANHMILRDGYSLN